jgi:hypothetical protein
MTTQNVDGEGMENKSEEEDAGVEFSVLLSGITRLAFPLLLLLLAINYVNTTWGRIRTDNLQYPYIVIGLMTILILLVMYEEIQELIQMDGVRTTKQALSDYVTEWKVTILFSGILISYGLAVPFLGFFTSSLLAMVVIMAAAGVRDYKIGLLVIACILTTIWLMFVEFIGVNPPSGIIDSLFR